MDDGSPSRAGLRIGSRRISNLPLVVLFRRFCLFGAGCLFILYLGALGVGHSQGFAYLAATEVGEALGDFLTAKKSRVDASLRHLELLDVQTITNRNQKVVNTSIGRVGLRWNYRTLAAVEMDGFSCDIRVRRDGRWIPSRMNFLAKLPLFNQLPLPTRTHLPAASGAAALPGAAEDEAPAESTDRLDFRSLPPLRIRDGSFRLRDANGEILADFQGIQLDWTPATPSTDEERFSLRARYRFSHRKVPELELVVEISRRNGAYVIERIEAEQSVLAAMGPFLDSLRSTPSSGPAAVSPAPREPAPATAPAPAPVPVAP